jgi:predicted ribonuclease YlaK
MARRTVNNNHFRQPCSEKLKQYKRDLADIEKRLIFCVGLPSTGKTRCAVEIGLQQVMDNKYDKLIIIRPVIQPECGLLPGTIMEKMQPYIRQAGIYCESYNRQNLDELIRYGKLEVLPADLLQGDRFQNCFVIMDEMQNIHKDKTFAILSRVGENSKFVVIGDVSKGQQNKKIKHGETMLDYCVNKFYNKDYTAVHSFYEPSDVLGDACTKDIILTLIEDFM